MEPRHVHPLKWRHAVEVARETCSRLFADGRSPADAVRSFGLVPSATTGWAGAVNAIAELHHASPARRWVA